jgi:beta-fructofuranosidase
MDGPVNIGPADQTPVAGRRYLRPKAHLSAPRNWLNDPVGLVHWQGRYHLFYQHHPFAPAWGLMHWGHASSADLVAWTQHGIALAPDADGPDRDGCWSGSIVVVDGVPTAFYTGANGEDDAHRQEVCRATSDGDLTTWRKDPANPIIPGASGPGTDHRRDPFLVRLDDRWLLLLGTGITGPSGLRHGAVMAYESRDLTTWQERGILFRDPGDGSFRAGGVWECPQLVRLGGRWLLIVSVQARGGPDPVCLGTAWAVGDLDGTRFIPTSAGWMDGGNALYAPALLEAPDGRCLLWAWLQDPEPDLRGPDPVVGAISLPRVLELVDDRPVSRPAEELAGLAVGEAMGIDDARLGPDDAFRVTVDVTTRSFAGVRLLASDDDTRAIVVGVDDRDGTPSLAMVEATAEGLTTLHAIPLALDDAPVRLDVFVDAGIVEAFAGGVAIAARVDRGRFPAPRLALVADAGDVTFGAARVTSIAMPITEAAPAS